MWNGATCQSLGTIRLKLRNPKNNKKYSVSFTVVNADLTPLLGSTASQQMGHLTVNTENFIPAGEPPDSYPTYTYSNLNMNFLSHLMAI